MLRLGEELKNPVKQMLKENKKVLAAWLQMASPYAAEIFAKAEERLKKNVAHRKLRFDRGVGRLHLVLIGGGAV